MSRPLPRWPLFLIAAPAAIAVWSGWVGLGTLCGFGVIHPLPGIWDALKLNTAITLPIGVEAYGSYALAAWLSPATPQRARRFARWSAQRQAYEDRVRQLQDDQARWLRSIYTDDAGSSAPTPERAQPEPVDAPPAGRSFPAGTAPAGHPDPWAAAKQAADDIKTMSMAEYAARRAALGVRSSTDMTRLVGG